MRAPTASESEYDVAESDENPYLPPSSEAVRAEPTQRKPVLVSVAKCAFAGFSIGVISRLVRPFVRTADGLHVESLIAGLLLLGLCVAVPLSVRRKQPMSIVGVLVLCAATWMCYAVGWTVVHGKVWDDILVATVNGAAVSMVLGTLPLLLLGRKFPG